MKNPYWGRRWCYRIIAPAFDKQFGMSFWWNSGRAGITLQFWTWEFYLTREWEKGL